MTSRSPRNYDDDWLYQPTHPGYTGSGHSVSSEPAAEDRAEQVRKVAEEVTGKTMPRKTTRIGF